MLKGMIGKKLGMTTIYDKDGNNIPVTVIEVGPCTVLQIKTLEKDGYEAVQLGFDEKRQKSATKPEQGHAKKANTTPKKVLREVLLEENAQVSPGDQIRLEQVFKVGDFVDVSGRTIGKGFQGVVKRWGFKGSPAAHGTHEFFRHGGSIGTNTTPGRVLKGRKMPGHMGNKNKTILNLKVVDMKPEDNLLLVKGSVPGKKNSYVIVRKAVKKQAQQATS